MASPKHFQPSDLRGAARLATEAVAGLADLVEAMHERIARVPLTGRAAADGRTSGITGLVYKSVRGVTRLVGGSVDALLGVLTPALAADDGSAEREAVLAALNGVLGDHLQATHNPLATSMSLRYQGRALNVLTDEMNAALPRASGHLLVLLHGLCMNDRQWLRNGHDHGEALAQALGCTPVYLRYNSGLHVSTNGRELARQLDALLQAWPVPVQRLTLLGHSMGGLVARSALHLGLRDGQRWAQQTSELVCLGTPHHGAPLERAGHGVDILLGATPYTAPLARLGKVRSAGITDLRYGLLLDEDWVGRSRFARGVDQRAHVPLPAHVRCFAAAACLGASDAATRSRVLGDGLVGVDSALGRHADAARCLDFAAERSWVGHGMGHLDLLSHPDVAQRLRQWLA
jgi:pimeloyl-ACP methyl ester carboxylesterase